MSSPVHPDLQPKRVTFLAKVPMFAGLKETDLSALASDFHLKEYEKDEIIFRQEETSRELYIVFRGKVRIFRNSPGGNETSITIFTTYDVLGEFAAIDNLPRSATAKALVPTALLVISQERFLGHLRTIPDLALTLARLLVSKVRWTAAYAETIAQYDAAGRLLHILLLYNQQFGEVIEPGKQYVLDLALNQSDLASLVGARREWINRILRDWSRRRLIKYKAGKIFILDLAGVVAERDRRIEANQSQEW